MNATPYPLGRLPLDISTHGAGIDRLIEYVHIFMLVLFVGWGIYFVYCLIKFRERPGHAAQLDDRHFNLPKYIEVGIVCVEVVLLVFFSSPVWGKYKNDFPDRKDAVVIKIVAEQFAWNVRYAGRDGKFGPTEIAKIDSASNPVGVDRESEFGKDDIVTINNLHVPIGKPIVIDLTSKDVIHSFGLPVARVKQDVIPGMEIPIHFEVKETGEFDIQCAQLCGVGHYRMRGQFIVQTQEEFDKWLAEQHKELMGDAADAAPAAASAAVEAAPVEKKTTRKTKVKEESEKEEVEEGTES